MRHVIIGVVTGILLALPAAAQQAATPAPAASQTKDNKSQQAAKPAPAPDPAPPAKDESITRYDVTGSNASDAMGAGPP